MDEITKRRTVNGLVGEIRLGRCKSHCIELTRKNVPSATEDEINECVAMARSLFKSGAFALLDKADIDRLVLPVLCKEPKTATEPPAQTIALAATAIEPPAPEKPAVIIDETMAAQIAAARALAIACEKELTEKASLIDEDELKPLVALFDQIIGGADGPLAGINTLLKKQKLTSLTTTDVAFITAVHRDSIATNKEGASPTWRVVKRARQHPYVSKLKTNHAGKIFHLLCQLQVCKQTGEANREGKQCATFEWLNNPLFDQFISKIAGLRL